MSRKRLWRKMQIFIMSGVLVFGVFSKMKINAAETSNGEMYEHIVSQVGDYEMKQLGEQIRADEKNSLVVTPIPESTSGTVYYVSPNGNDANSGISQDAPWRTIEKVNSITFQPGDMILFQADSVWDLTVPLHPLGSGQEGKPIVIGAYGEGRKPHFEGKNIDMGDWIYSDTEGNLITKNPSDVVYLENQEYIEIRDLEISNTPDAYDGGGENEDKLLLDDRRGVHVVATVGETKKELKGIHIHDLYVHEVIGDAITVKHWDASKRVGGIVFEVILKDEETGLPVIGHDITSSLEGYEPAWFSDVVVEKNVMMDNSYSSIAFKQLKKWGERPDKGSAPSYYYTEEQGWYPHRNITIQNNFLDHMENQLAANTIYVTCSKDSLVQYNYSVGAGTCGIETYFSDSIVVQYNEVYKSMKKPTGTDSNGIDADKSTTNIVIQYNYLKDCNEGFLLCGFTYGSTIVRYNVVEDAALRYINIHSSKGYNHIYNNIFYNSSDTAASFIASSGGSSYMNDINTHYFIYNNTFYSPNVTSTIADGLSTEYSGNHYEGVEAKIVYGEENGTTQEYPSEDSTPVFGAPEFLDSASLTGGSGQKVNLEGLQVSSTSPLINAAQKILADENGNHKYTIMYP